MKAFILFTTLALTACGYEREPLTVDPDFQPALDLYLSIAPDRGNYDELVSISYSTDLPDGVDGACEVIHAEGKAYGVKYAEKPVERRIKIRPGTLPAPSFLLYATVAHELGHCLHGFPHVEGERKALMAPSVYDSEEYWQTHLPQQIARLFR